MQNCAPDEPLEWKVLDQYDLPVTGYNYDHLLQLKNGQYLLFGNEMIISKENGKMSSTSEAFVFKLNPQDSGFEKEFLGTGKVSAASQGKNGEVYLVLDRGYGTAAAHTSTYVSNDRGENWKLTGSMTEYIRELGVRNSKEIYGIIQDSSKLYHLHLSDDAGDTWGRPLSKSFMHKNAHMEGDTVFFISCADSEIPARTELVRVGPEGLETKVNMPKEFRPFFIQSADGQLLLLGETGDGIAVYGQMGTEAPQLLSQVMHSPESYPMGFWAMDSIMLVIVGRIAGSFVEHQLYYSNNRGRSWSQSDFPSLLTTAPRHFRHIQGSNVIEMACYAGKGQRGLSEILRPKAQIE